MLATVIKASISEAMRNRTAFVIQVLIMMGNDVMWIAFWRILFRNTSSIAGWDVNEMTLLLAQLMFGVGVVTGFCDNARRLGHLISSGELDAALTLPVDVLGYLCLRRARPLGIGDMLFGIVIYFTMCNPTLTKTFWFFTSGILGSLIFLSFLIIVNSAAFFVRGSGHSAEIAFDGAITFAMYPIDIFGGLTRAILFTALPVGLFATLPARLTFDFQLSSFAVLLVVASSLCVLARVVFYLGLRRYRSGSQWTRA